jgi:hypothetical protein
MRILSLPAVAILGIGVGLIAVSWGGRVLYDPNANSAARAGLKERPAHGPYRRAEFDDLVQEVAACEQEAAQLTARSNLNNRM